VHLAQRAYVLLVLTAVLAIAGMWSDEPAIAPLWHWPAALLLLGIGLESVFIRRAHWRVGMATASRAFLGRPQAAAFAFDNDATRDLLIEFAPVVPQAVEPLGAPRRVRAAAAGRTLDEVVLVPIGLGTHLWPAIPTRVLGRFELIWWSRQQPVACSIAVAPDTARFERARSRGMPSGSRPRRRPGAGSELYQLRKYVAGDPLGRIDWKATARVGALISRELSEDQHLDILIAIDAGRASRIRAGRLDRLGLYANIAARFAEAVTPNDDRIGLVVFSDRILVVSAPERGTQGVIRLRRALERLVPQSAESDPVAAAIRMRALLKHRSLIVLFTELEDATVADPLARAVRLLSPPHLVVAAGVRSAELLALAADEAHSWRDPWVALAARERETRAAGQRALLQRLGAPVVAEREERLQPAVLAQYELLRRARRI
jgi:uncharacterized protein (DUF58 family)